MSASGVFHGRRALRAAITPACARPPCGAVAPRGRRAGPGCGSAGAAARPAAGGPRRGAPTRPPRGRCAATPGRPAHPDARQLAQRPCLSGHIAVPAVSGDGGVPVAQRLAVAARVGVRGGDTAVQPGGVHPLVPCQALGERPAVRVGGPVGGRRAPDGRRLRIPSRGRSHTGRSPRVRGPPGRPGRPGRRPCGRSARPGRRGSAGPRPSPGRPRRSATSRTRRWMPYSSGAAAGVPKWATIARTSAAISRLARASSSPSATASRLRPATRAAGCAAGPSAAWGREAQFAGQRGELLAGGRVVGLGDGAAGHQQPYGPLQHPARRPAAARPGGPGCRRGSQQRQQAAGHLDAGARDSTA